MDYLNKSKDELIIELKKLQQNYDSLKALYDADIAERKQVENSLRESEERFSKAYMTSPISFLIANMEDGKIIEVNDAFTTLSGYSRTEALLNSTLNLKLWVHEEDRQKMIATLREGRAMVSQEIMLRSKNGTIHTALFSAQVIQLGKKFCIISSIEDITQRKIIENELLVAKEKAEESEKQLKAVFDNSKDAIGISQKGTTVMVNQAYLKMFGYKNLDEIIGKSILNQISPKEHVRIKQFVDNRKIDNRIPSNYETLGIRKNGEEFPFEMNVSTYILNNQEYSIGIIRDITERKQAEKALRENEEKYSRIVNTASEGIRVVDKNNIITYVNIQMAEMLGYLPEEMVNQPMQNFVFVDELPKYNKRVEKQKAGITEKAFETRLSKKDGTIIWVSMTSTPIIDGDKVFQGSFAMVTDITERKNIEAKIIESEAKYKNIYDNALEGMYRTSLEGKNMHANKALADILGYNSPEEVINNVTDSGHQVWFNADDRLIYTKLLDEKGIIKSFECQFKRVDGRIIWVSLDTRLVRDEFGNKLYYEGFLTDITKRKYSEQELLKAKEKAEESEERFRSIYENSTIGIYRTTPDGKILMCNPTLIKKLGFSSFEEISSRNLESEGFEPTYQRKQFIEQIERDGEVNGLEAIWMCLDGSILYMRESAKAIRDENGKTLYYDGTAEDITDRKRAEQELISAKEKAKESEINLQTILSSTTDIIASYDLNICLLTYNKACSDIYRQIFGIEIYPGLCTLNLFPESLRDFWILHNSRAIAGETFSIEINIPTTNGELTFEQYYNPIFKEGKVVCFSTFTRDITEKKRIEIELIKAKEKAEESDRLKTAFLQNMSHEIRTPMNAIMGFSDLIRNQYNNKEKVEKFSEIINQRCNDLLDIINDILDISKIESGQLPVNDEECNINELFTELTSFFEEHQKRINKKQIKFSLQSFCADSENMIVTDKVKLKQIFINLISNAFKFTDEGKIEGGCKLDKNHNLLFYLTDTGIGIPSDKHGVIFERFSQLQSTKKNVGGTGLGLPIVKALVGLLGGEIHLESEPTKGSTFSFAIPYKLSQPLHHHILNADKLNDKSLSNKIILIVEDDPYNAEYLQEILSGIDLHVLIVENGQKAIEISLSQPIDIVLMDIRLPDMNGYEATQKIKLHKPNLKIIAQTAYAAQDEKQKAFNAGCCDYISKPTKQDLLLATIHKHLS